MIKKFDTFLNEAARAKFPEYKVGDEVLMLAYHEFQYSGRIPVAKWETYNKYSTSRDAGAMGKIVEVDMVKKEYVVEFTAGILKTVYRGRSSGGSYVTPGKDITDRERSKIYLRVKQADITTEGLQEIQKLLKDDSLRTGEKVSVKISNDKSVTRSVVGVSLSKTIENKKLTYSIEGVSNTVPIDLIEKEIDVNDQNTQELIAEEIAKVLGTKMIDKSGSGLNTEFVYEVAFLEGSKMINGHLFFKDDNAREKFVQDLQKFIDSKLDKNLQKVMLKGESSEVKVLGIGNSMSSWYKAKITAQKIVQAARNIGIDVTEFLEKKRGVITGKKYGL
jgi:hypothetical protein